MDEKRKEEEVRELTPEEIDDMILEEQIASGEHNEKVPEYYFSNPDPYAKVEPRTDSNHCRQYPENYCFLRCRLPDESRSLSLQKRIDRRFESSPESRGSQTSGVLFGYFLHDAKSDNSFSLLEASRFCKPRSSTPQPQLRTATIKTFLREL
ncbi:MAG: hypothetical protein ACOYIO_06805 [Eubacteriales bacterium]|jgi:hypothetical protein